MSPIPDYSRYAKREITYALFRLSEDDEGAILTGEARDALMRAENALRFAQVEAQQRFVRHDRASHPGETAQPTKRPAGTVTKG